jgi:hypothetical protein
MSEKITLKLVSVPKFERQQATKIEKAEEELVKCQSRKGKSEDDKIHIEQVKLRIKLLKEEKPLWRLDTPKGIVELEIGDTYEFEAERAKRIMAHCNKGKDYIMFEIVKTKESKPTKEE